MVTLTIILVITHHPNHIKRNISFYLAKLVFVFVLDEQRVALQLKQSVIYYSFYIPNLQSLANKPANSKIILAYHSNFDMQNIVKSNN